MPKDNDNDIFIHQEGRKLPKLNMAQLKSAADMIVAEWKRRKEHKDRVEVQKRWDEIDRQVAMTPDPNKNRKTWHPRFELPFQANALEVLSADADQMLFPGNGVFFNVHAQMTNEYLDRFQKDVLFLNGDNPELDRFEATQENINEVNQALLIHAHDQYNFQDAIKLSNSEAFKYGTRAVRVRAVEKTTFQNQFKGVLRSESLMPVVAPISIKDFYPDDLAYRALAHGMHLRPMEIMHGQHRLVDLKMAAKRGSTDTRDAVNGGWVKDVVSTLELNGDDAIKNPFVEFLEVEGDLVLPSKSGKDRVFPNMITTVVFGRIKSGPEIIRIRENPFSFNSVFWSQYFQDCIGVYGTSPLMKGASLQKIAQQAAESVVITSVMQARPALLVNRSDPMFRKTGSVEIYPDALLDLLSKPEALNFGDLTGQSAVFAQMAKLHEDTTSSTAQRLGAQTKSHQTAAAIDQEAQRGQSRTVAFVRSQERGFLTNILQAEAEILRKDMKKQNVFIPRQGAYVVASGDSVAPDLTFSVTGSSAATEELQREAKMAQTIQSLIQIEQLSEQRGDKRLNLDYLKELFVRQAFPAADIERVFSPPAASQAPVAPGGAPPLQAVPDQFPGG